MDFDTIQSAFFRQVKEKLASHQSLPDVIAELLHISPDSAYRRIRGEKAMTLDEIQILANHFRVSIDQFLQADTGIFIFNGELIDRTAFDLGKYLRNVVQQLQSIAGAHEKEMLYSNKDIPLFHHFLFPELAAFKCYFWSRYNLNYPGFNKGHFLISDFIELFNKTGSEIASLYLQIPSTEIWNLDCINTTIRQIDYYRESKVFKSNEDIITVYDRLEKLVDHLEQQAETGYKFAWNEKPAKKIKYNVYVNEFILGDNTICAQCDGQKMVFFNHNVINYITTTNAVIVDYTFQTMQTLLQKSTLISETGEKSRQLFFDTLRERIHQKKILV